MWRMAPRENEEEEEEEDVGRARMRWMEERDEDENAGRRGMTRTYSGDDRPGARMCGHARGVRTWTNRQLSAGSSGNVGSASS